MLGLLAKKVGMTQVFDAEGNGVPVTVLEILENAITEKRNQKEHGYNAIQIGGEAAAKESKLTKPEIGHLKKSNSPLFRTLKEFRVSAELLEKYEVGQALDAGEILGEEGSLVDVTSRPIGRGTSGRIQRWNQHRRTMTHGTKHHRQIGSAGAGTTPGRVLKGLHMPGRDNNLRTTSHLMLVKLMEIEGKKVALVKGSVSGYKGCMVVVQASKKLGTWNKLAFDLGKAVKRD
jgi:large subunit ribosomal protein L3